MTSVAADRIVVYVPKITPRARYIFDLIFTERMGLAYEFSTESECVHPEETPAIKYGYDPIEGLPFIAASRLIFETGIRQIDLSWTEIPEPVLFAGIHRNSALAFDPFAASFFLLSRYEEYLPFRPDTHGRFGLDQSVLRHKDYYRIPVVDAWVSILAGWLKVTFPGLQVREPEYSFLPTYDIDVAYAYRLKGLFRTLGGYFRDLFRLSFKDVSLRMKVISGNEADPYDTYSFQWELQERLGLEPLYFVLFGSYAEFDKNPSISDPAFQSLIKRLRDHARVGIHPSYRSNSSKDLLAREIRGLTAVINEPVTISRQHFIKLEIPGTYRNLAQLGITEDYSMGFPGAGGFRAGTSIPFRFFDLEYELELPLMVFPFAIMDGTLRDYLAMEPGQALDYVRELNRNVRRYGGIFITIWHNESLSGRGRWASWSELYEEIARLASAPEEKG